MPPQSASPPAVRVVASRPAKRTAGALIRLLERLLTDRGPARWP